MYLDIERFRLVAGAEPPDDAGSCLESCLIIFAMNFLKYLPLRVSE